MIHIINRRTHPHLETVYAGHGSKWGNTYSIGIDGDRDEVIRLFRWHLWSMLKTKDVTLSELRALDGETLGCFCKPKACHVDVIVEAVEWAKTIEGDDFDRNTLPGWVV